MPEAVVANPPLLTRQIFRFKFSLGIGAGSSNEENGGPMNLAFQSAYARPRPGD
jgi:hypothetical protein